MITHPCEDYTIINMIGIDSISGVLTPLSALFQLYHGGQF